MREKRKEEQKRLEEERKERIRVRNKLEEKWAMVRWLSEYIEVNQESWEVERREREEERNRTLREWEKSARFEKIRKIKEREKSKLEKKEKSRENLAQEDTIWRWGDWRKKRGEDREVEIDPIVTPPK